MLFEAIIFVLCLVASAFYSATEAAILSIGPDRARQLHDSGGKWTKVFRFLLDHPNGILTTILIGNNAVNTLAAAVATQMAREFFEKDALAIAVGLTTFLILFFGEIIPKTFGRAQAERFVVPAVYLLKVNYFLMYPLVWLFIWFIKNILGSNATLTSRIVTRDDLEFLILKAEQDKSIDSKQIDLLSSIMEFPTIKVKDIMISRNKVVGIDSELDFTEIMKIVKNDTYSRYPVYVGDMDHVIGFLHVKDLVFVEGEDIRNFNVKKHLKKSFFVYEHMKIQSVFDHMNRKKIHLALVKDENGIVVGIVTLEDIIEEVLGEIHDEHDDEEDSVTKDHSGLGDGAIVEASMNIRDLDDNYGIVISPSDNYSTLNGFLLDLLGNTFPRKGQLIVWEHFSFELLEVDNFHIKKVRIADVDGERHFFKKNQNSDDSSGERGSI